MPNPFDQFDQAENPFDKFDDPSPNVGKAQAVKEITQQESWYEDPVMAARAFLDGVVLGWSDEAGAAVAAGAAKLINGDERPYSDVYSEMQSLLQQERDQFAQDHTGASIALNVAGGFLSPANAVAPGTGIRGSIVRGGAEGAIAGAGASEQGERAGGAALGLGIGSVLGGGFATAGRVVDQATKRRVAQSLGEGDDFIPLNLAVDQHDGVEGFIGGFYRDVVGKTFGGHSKIWQQGERLRLSIAEASNKTEASLAKTIGNAKSSVAAAKKRLSAQSNQQSVRVKDAFSDAKREFGDTVDASKNQFAELKDGAKASAIRDLDKTVNNLENDFRSTALRSSIPEGTPADEIEAIINMPVHDAMAHVDNMWTQRGFDMIKNRSFKIDVNETINDVTNLLKSDPVIQAQIALSPKPNAINNYMRDFLKAHVTDGEISGEAMSALRSSLGSANKYSDAGGEAALLGSIMSRMQDVLNDKISLQLSPSAKKAFDLHRTQWSTNKILRSSVTAASRKAGREGMFTPDEWVTNAATQSPRAARQGTAPLQSQANEVANISKQRDSIITQEAEKAVAAAAKQRTADLNRARAGLSKAMKQKEKELAEIKRRTMAGEAKAKLVLGKENEIATLTQKLDQIKEQAKQFKEIDVKSASQMGLFERLFASGLLGTGYGMANLASGTLLGRSLASQGAQRAIAGQTKSQQLAQELIERYGKDADKLGRSITRAAALELE